ncbi:formylglycine-generating enzyme family protein [Maridesulfovibrio sp.]|uniref:formylglycine-generating enzyme family protein n=1 Tax=Maridesulfovibrio sp. TaxID=2795000 RepID=UPI002A189DE7|nr:formylglycine-generating enzyme family protein [Maridesulfovibrio sp.]
MKQFILTITVLMTLFMTIDALASDKGVNAEWLEPFTGMEFVWVPAGCFMMGSPELEKGRMEHEGPQRKVCVDGFWMGKYEVTRGEWVTIMGRDPDYYYFSGFEKYPMDNVSWDDTQKFIQKLNAKGVGKFRLPTEAEWEYACRADSTTRYSFGDTINTDQANYIDEIKPSIDSESIKAVGTLGPNKFGLYDMHGNIWEWCEDTFEWYPSGPARNPLIVKSDNPVRVVRGGSGFNSPEYLRSAFRGGYKQNERQILTGLRLVRSP